MDLRSLSLPSSPVKIPGLTPLRPLGVGGRCAVWLARRTCGADSAVDWILPSKKLPETVALKIPLQSARGSVPTRTLRAELEAMVPLLHEHLVKPLGIASTAGAPVLILQAYTGGSLARFLRTSRMLTPGQAVTVFSPVAQALAHLHDCGAAHGDVSAANILLTPEGRPGLADLGDSTLLGMEHTAGTAAEDIRQLAIATWYALTGQLPDGDQRRAPLAALLPRARRELGVLLEDALEADPGSRPSAWEFASEIYRCAEPEALDMTAHADDATLQELPTVLPATQKPGPHRRGTGFLRFWRLVPRMRRWIRPGSSRPQDAA